MVRRFAEGTSPYLTPDSPVSLHPGHRVHSFCEQEAQRYSELIRQDRFDFGGSGG